MCVSSKLCKKDRWRLLVCRGDCGFRVVVVWCVVELRREGGNERDNNVVGGKEC
jgi:hypothetical protein